MATPIFLTGFEHQAPVTSNGGGLYLSTMSGTWAIDTGTKNTGNAGLKGTFASGAAGNVRSPRSVAGATIVQRVYVRFTTLPTGTVVVNVMGAINTPATSFPSVSYNPNTGYFSARVGTSGTQEDNVTVAANTWYCIDSKVVITGGNTVLDVQIDGRAIATVTVATTATGHTNGYLGTSRTDHAVAWDTYYDDWIVSATAGDYPIGAGGTEILLPAADGTHSIAANTLEDNAGNDINGTTVTAYDKINSVPPSAAAYIMQNGNSAASYAEVVFADISASHSAIIGAQAGLAYTSATTTANNGATMVSKDGFSTKTDVWGNNTTPADMSDGATANLFFKTAIVSGAVDDTTINALTGRVGYSADADPDPYWIDLWVEVAYVPGTPPASAVVPVYMNQYRQRRP